MAPMSEQWMALGSAVALEAAKAESSVLRMAPETAIRLDLGLVAS